MVGTFYMDERTLGCLTETIGMEPMRVAILQPSYLPWLGFFDQMHRSDQFVLLMTFNSHAETGETETESGFVKVLHG